MLCWPRSQAWCPWRRCSLLVSEPGVERARARIPFDKRGPLERCCCFLWFPAHLGCFWKQVSWIRNNPLIDRRVLEQRHCNSMEVFRDPGVTPGTCVVFRSSKVPRAVLDSSLWAALCWLHEFELETVISCLGLLGTTSVPEREGLALCF